jgi:hypothetical protein
MTKNVLGLFTAAVVAGAVMFLAAGPLDAHHSFAAEYDSKKPVELKGIVTKVEWMNPHVYFYVDVTDDKGKTTNWAFEMGPPRLLENSGWKKSTIKEGVEVVVQGSLARDGSPQVNARSVTVAATGQRLGAASSEGRVE